MVILKNSESEFSYILAELFIMCLKDSCFLGLLKCLIGGPCMQECWEKYTAKNCFPVSLLSVVSKVFEKLVNNRIVDSLDQLQSF